MPAPWERPSWATTRRLARALGLLALISLLVATSFWLRSCTKQEPPPVAKRSRPAPRPFRLVQSPERVGRLRSTLAKVSMAAASGKKAEAVSLSRSTVQSLLSARSATFQPDEFHLLYAMARRSGDNDSQGVLAKAWLGAFAADPRHGAEMGWTEVVELAGLLEGSGDKEGLRKVCAFAREELRNGSNDHGVPSYMDLHALQGAAGTVRDRDLEAVCRAKMTALAGSGTVFPPRLAPFEIGALAESARTKKDAAPLRKLAAFIVHDYLPQPGLADALTAQDWMLHRQRGPGRPHERWL